MEMTFAELLEKHDVKIYNKFRITARTDNKLLGGWPKNAETELAMLEARANKGLVKPETVEEARQRVQDLSSDDPEEETEKAKMKAWTGFKSDDKGIYIESRQIKAGFKEMAQVTGQTNTHRGSRQVLQHGFFIRGHEHEDNIYFYRKPYKKDGSPEDRERLTEPDGFVELVAHVIGPQGPRSTIKFHDYVVAPVFFEFEIWFTEPKAGRVDEKYLAVCMEVGQDNGFGCSRSQGYGRVKWLTIEQTQEGVLPKPASKTPKKTTAKKGDDKAA